MKAATMQLKTFEVNPQLLFFVHLSSQQMDEAWWPCWNLSASASAWRWIMWSGSLQSPSTGASQCSSRWAPVKRSSPHFLPTHHQLSHIMAFLADPLLKMFRYQTERLKSRVTKFCFCITWNKVTPSKQKVKNIDSYNVDKTPQLPHCLYTTGDTIMHCGEAISLKSSIAVN